MANAPIQRREFLTMSAVSAAAAMAAEASVAAADAEKLQQSAAPSQSHAPAVAEQPQPPHPAELIVEVIRRQYADERLTPGVLKEIEGDVRADLLRSRGLSAFPLKNSDEPAFVFAAWRADDVH